MEDKSVNGFNWQIAIDETYQEFSQQIIDYAPQLFGAVALLAIGWVIAHFAKLSTQKIVQGFDALYNKLTKPDNSNRLRIKKSYALIISKVIFWAVMLFFLAASANLLGWKIFFGWLESIISFLPNLITGIIIIIAGFVISNTVRSGIASAAATSGSSQKDLLARTAQIVIIFSSVVIGVEQIGLNVAFLTSLVVVVVGVITAGAAFAFSLGAKSLVANLIGAHNTRSHCQIGEHLKIKDVEGDVIDITQTNIILETVNGRAVIPAKFFQENIAHVSTLGDDNISPTEKPSDDKKEG